MPGLYPDEKTVNVFGTEVSYPGLDPETGKFTDGDFSDPLKKPSFIPAGTMNLVLDNLQSFIAGLGLAPNNAEPDQLLKALANKYSTAGWMKNYLFPVGCSYIQSLNDSTPLERGLPGEWEIWNGRADGYGLVAPSTAIPAFTTYKQGANYAAGAYVMYHLAGDDYALFRAKAAIAGAPQYLDPVKWDKYAPAIIIERRNLQGWTDDDFEIGGAVPDGIYAGWKVCEVIVPGGKFPSFAGGHRPTFVDGGVATDRIKNIMGRISSANMGAFLDATGVFFAETPWSSVASAIVGNSNVGASFSAARVVLTGPDVAPRTISDVKWRRVS